MPSGSQGFTLLCIICGLRRWKMQISVNKCQIMCPVAKKYWKRIWDQGNRAAAYCSAWEVNVGLFYPEQTSREARNVSVQNWAGKENLLALVHKHPPNTSQPQRHWLLHLIHLWSAGSISLVLKGSLELRGWFYLVLSLPLTSWSTLHMPLPISGPVFSIKW